MAGYLDQYGAGEERRNRIIIRSILGVVLAVVLVALTWYLTLNHHQESVVKSFIAALKNHDTQGAYRIWGCTTSHPCPDYPYEKFLSDWEECNSAAMLTVQVNPNRVEQLWLDKGSDLISFAPFPICPQQIPYEIMAHRTLGKLRKILLH